MDRGRPRPPRPTIRSPRPGSRRTGHRGPRSRAIRRAAPQAGSDAARPEAAAGLRGRRADGSARDRRPRRSAPWSSAVRTSRRGAGGSNPGAARAAPSAERQRPSARIRRACLAGAVRGKRAGSPAGPAERIRTARGPASAHSRPRAPGGSPDPWTRRFRNRRSDHPRRRAPVCGRIATVALPPAPPGPRAQGSTRSSSGGQVHTRLRSPKALSMREIGGQNLCCRVQGAG